MKNVLITGGSRGIGAACVRLFSSLGDNVTFIYNKSTADAQKLCTETGATALRADAEDIEAWQNAVLAAVDRMGGIDVLVNNAGVSLIRLFGDTANQDLCRVLSVDLTAAAVAAREASRRMIAVKHGYIINIGSVWGRVGASCEVAYSAAKAGIEGLTKALAKELGPSGITVNCVEPGVIRTDMNKELTQNVLTELRDETPLCRLGEPREVAQAVAFLCSGNADFITGQILGVDGGFGL